MRGVLVSIAPPLAARPDALRHAVEPIERGLVERARAGQRARAWGAQLILPRIVAAGVA